MHSAPKVSVIIPVYNTEQYLRECLDNVVSQTLSEIEVICIDDGSSDSSVDILREYAEKDDRITVLVQQNCGAGSARNKGINSAKGEYVAFMDSDDYYPEKTTLEKLYDAASDHSANICGGSFSSLRKEGIVTEYPEMLKGYTFKENKEMWYRDYQFDYGYHRFLYRREFLIENGLYFPDYRRYQDPPFFVKAMITSEKFFAITDVTYRYRTQQRNNFADDRKKLDNIKGLTDNLKMALDNNLDELYQLTVARCYKDFWFVLKAADESENEELQKALAELNDAIDIKRLKDDYSEIYKLHYIRNIKCPPAPTDNKEADLIRASASYKIGRFITWIPRKIRSLIKGGDKKN